AIQEWCGSRNPAASLSYQGRMSRTRSECQFVSKFLLQSTSLGISRIERPSTTLLALVLTWYPLLPKEDTHGRACQSDGVAGAERLSERLPGALPSTGGHRSFGTVYDRAAHRAAHQKL